MIAVFLLIVVNRADICAYRSRLVTNLPRTIEESLILSHSLASSRTPVLPERTAKFEGISRHNSMETNYHPGSASAAIDFFGFWAELTWMKSGIEGIIAGGMEFPNKRQKARVMVESPGFTGRGPGSAFPATSPIPREFAEHQLVKDQLFFTVPGGLLLEVLREVGEDRFDPNLLRLERELSRISGNHSASVGFWGGRPIAYTLLHREPLQLSDSDAAYMGLQDPARRASFVKMANDRLDRFIPAARGYCGWLLLNREFRQEHVELWLFSKACG